MAARRISSGQGSLEAAHMTCVGRDTVATLESRKFWEFSRRNLMCYLNQYFEIIFRIKIPYIYIYKNPFSASPKISLVQKFFFLENS